MVQRKLAAILAADVAGYSRLVGADEEGTIARLSSHRRILIDPKIKQHHGRIVKTTGDGMLIEFASAVDAVRCAAEIQRAMVDRNASVPEEKRITLRTGINVGDIIVEGDDILGDGVNVAARLEALAQPGGVCISGTVYDYIRDKLPLPFTDQGEQTVTQRRSSGVSAGNANISRRAIAAGKALGFNPPRWPSTGRRRRGVLGGRRSIARVQADASAATVSDNAPVLHRRATLRQFERRSDAELSR
jgi:hypothetical protein